MKKVLVKLHIVQQRTINDAFRRPYGQQRLNPYNPLTYILLLFTLVLGLLMFGFVGIWEQINMDDLKFKWR